MFAARSGRCSGQAPTRGRAHAATLAGMQPRALFELFKQAVLSWKADYAPSMGAALAYYTVFSVAPLLLIVISVAGLVFGQ
jgi:membrane protein